MDDEEKAKIFAELDRKRAANDVRASEATRAAGPALSRLLALAEHRNSGQIERIALFLGAVWNGRRHFDLYDLRALDVEISDDMLTVLDALRWGRVGIGELAPGADLRIERVLTAWGMFGDGQTGQFIATGC